MYKKFQCYRNLQNIIYAFLYKNKYVMLSSRKWILSKLKAKENNTYIIKEWYIEIKLFLLLLKAAKLCKNLQGWSSP